MQFTKPPVASPRERGLCTCLRVRAFLRGARSQGAGACWRADVPGVFGSPHPGSGRVPYGEEGAPARVCRDLAASERPRVFDPGATGQEAPRLGSPGAAAGRSLATRGAGERTSLEPGRSPPCGCSRLLLRPAAEQQLAGGSAVRLVRLGPVSKRVSGRERERETAAAAAARRAERAKGERPCPAPRRPLRLPGAARSLPPPAPSSPGPASSLRPPLDD